jgi:quinolinate synthase
MDALDWDERTRKLREEVLALKQETGAVLVAHNYQRDEVQDVADLVGDSLALARFCATSERQLIVFCGVHFMAESAKVLSPGKTVLLPEIDAGCPMADMVDEEGLRAWKAGHPGVAVVAYINSSAAVKAESDIICTSSNAIAVVRSLGAKEILFLPDCNLGQYVAEQVPEVKVDLWPGFCITHHRVRPEDLEAARRAHPDALLLAHPETQPYVWKQADFVGSTKQIIDYAAASPAKKFLIGTEMGVMWKLRKDSPDKTFYLLAPGMVCPNMKKITLRSVRDAMAEMKYRIEVPAAVADGARRALERMLAVRA